MVSKLAPIKLASLLMGVWLASSGVANVIAGKLAAYTQTLGYLEVFGLIGTLSIVMGLVLLAVSRLLVRMME
jgi:POT family proton-dependent oligopeptide transporter